MGKDEKCCLNCKIFWDKEYGCDECRFEHKDHPSLFYQITQSPEVLAEKLVYQIFDVDGYEWWTSTLCNYTQWELKAEAIAATVAKLKEVAK
jgi:hypothetical protein